MNLKKISPELLAGMKDAGFDTNPTQIQAASFPQIKSGADLFIISPAGTGKSTAILMGVIQQLKSASGDAPRAIIMASNREKAFELEEQFELLAKHTDLIVFNAFDKGDFQYQKDMIFEGLDLLIATPNRLKELFKYNGVRMSKVKMFVVDDADSYLSDKYGLIFKIADSIEKSQFLIVGDTWNKHFEKLTDRFMKNPRIIEV